MNWPWWRLLESSRSTKSVLWSQSSRASSSWDAAHGVDVTILSQTGPRRLPDTLMTPQHQFGDTFWFSSLGIYSFIYVFIFAVAPRCCSVRPLDGFFIPPMKLLIGYADEKMSPEPEPTAWRVVSGWKIIFGANYPFKHKASCRCFVVSQCVTDCTFSWQCAICRVSSGRVGLRGWGCDGGRVCPPPHTDLLPRSSPLSL